MKKKTCTDAEFISLFESLGPTAMANEIGVSSRNILVRRAKIEATQKIKILAPPTNHRAHHYESTYPARIPYILPEGVAIIVSDCHYWPDLISCAHRGAVALAKELQPKLFVLNGDGFDGASISRHPASRWEHKPTVREELETVEARTQEFRVACPDADFYWMLGNHDMRFEARLASAAPEFDGVPGFLLKDQFPEWVFGMSLWVNEDVVIKHRYRGGEHATHNNTIRAGKSIFTGHLHSLKVTAFTDYNGTRFGGDSGTLADPYGPQFSYSEDNPNNHRSGFLVLTFHEGELLMPEIARVVDANHIEFRGRIIAV